MILKDAGITLSSTYVASIPCVEGPQFKLTIADAEGDKAHTAGARLDSMCTVDLASIDYVERYKDELAAMGAELCPVGMQLVPFHGQESVPAYGVLRNLPLRISGRVVHRDVLVADITDDFLLGTPFIHSHIIGWDTIGWVTPCPLDWREKSPLTWEASKDRLTQRLKWHQHD